MLVAPVNKIEKYEERILEFKGLNKKPMIEDGEMSDMENLCSELYPSLYPCGMPTIHEPDTFLATEGVDIKAIHSMISKRDYIGDKNDYVAAIITYGDDLTQGFLYRRKVYSEVKELAESKGLSDLSNSHMVAINSKICIFPQNIYFDLGVTDEDVKTGKKRVGDLEFSYINKKSGGEGPSVSIDSNNGYLTMTIAESIAEGLRKDDVVKVTGELVFRKSGATVRTETWMNGGAASLDENTHEAAYPVVYGLTEDAEGNTILQLQLSAFDMIDSVSSYDEIWGGNIAIVRKVPDLNIVYEKDNRLWGVSNSTNTIYACKLGDPTNWEYYQQTSADSYYAEQGSNGDWTGIGYQSNHLCFFKEQSICKLYGTSPSTYQVSTIEAPGVEASSMKSIVSLNGMLIYNSPVGVMAYEGDYPYSISKKLTRAKLKNIVSGTDGVRYYMSSHDNDMSDGMYVLDIDNAVWHRESATAPVCYCMWEDAFFYASDPQPITASITINAGGEVV